MGLFFLLGGCLSGCVGDSGFLQQVGVIADGHHHQEGTGNLAEPSETAEYQKRSGNQSGNAHSRYLAVCKVAEEVTQHIAAVPIGNITQEVGCSVESG